MNIKEAIKCAGIVTTITVFVTMLLLTFIVFTKNSMITVYSSVVVFFGINLAALVITRRFKLKTRAVVIAVINAVLLAGLVLILSFVR